MEDPEAEPEPTSAGQNGCGSIDEDPDMDATQW